MTLCLALAALLSGPADAGPEIFLFPRAIRSASDTTKAEKAFVAEDRDVSKALSQIQAAVASPSKRLTATQRQVNEFDALLEKAKRLGRVLIPPDRPLDTMLAGFWQTKYRTSLSGIVLAIEFNLVTSVRQEGRYRLLRGYWVNYGVARVFFGAGVQIRFRISGGSSIFQRSNYQVVPMPSHGTLVDGQKVDRSALLFERYGFESPIFAYPSFSDPDFGQALNRTLEQCGKRMRVDFGDEVELVEPVLIEFDKPAAESYTAPLKATISMPLQSAKMHHGRVSPSLWADELSGRPDQWPQHARDLDLPRGA